jgi:aryl-alcohol dehydrogenase-like predicted oxidoreductase
MTDLDPLSSCTATQLGQSGPSVYPVGLGCMVFSGPYGSTDDGESVATIRHAIDRGITLLDSADFYGSGHNELLLRRGIEGLRNRVQLSVKFGMLRGPDGAMLGIDSRPNALKNFVTYSLKRLGVEVIDIYRPARLDPAVPIEDTVGAIADLIRDGYVRHIGLSEVGIETLRRASQVHPIVDLQIEYSLATRGPEASIFPALAELGMSATLYGVFSRGLLTGSKPSSAGDHRQYMPRFAGAQGAANADAIEQLDAFSKEKGMTPAQVALGWVLAKQPRLVPIIGARNRLQLDDTLVALENPLSASDIVALEIILPPDAIQGTRRFWTVNASLMSRTRSS